jgi:hypothetical protein
LARRPIIGPESDGLAGEILTAGPSTKIELGAMLSSAYLLVLSGGMDLAGFKLGPLSCAYLETGERPDIATDGQDGVQALLLRFPTPYAQIANLPIAT